MDLRSFVKSALIEMAEGVRDANTHIEALTGVKESKAYWLDSGGDAEQMGVSFDVAVVSSSSETAEGKGGLLIAGFGFGVKGESATEAQSVSRIRFFVRRNYRIA